MLTILISGAINAICAPYKVLCSKVAVTEAIMTGVKPIMLYSSMTTSIAKITPAIGVLNDAAIAPAVPHPTIRRRLLLGRWKMRPI